MTETSECKQMDVGGGPTRHRDTSPPKPAHLTTEAHTSQEGWYFVNRSVINLFISVKGIYFTGWSVNECQSSLEVEDLTSEELKFGSSRAVSQLFSSYYPSDLRGEFVIPASHGRDLLLYILYFSVWVCFCKIWWVNLPSRRLNLCDFMVCHAHSTTVQAEPFIHDQSDLNSSPLDSSHSTLKNFHLNTFAPISAKVL